MKSAYHINLRRLLLLIRSLLLINRNSILIITAVITVLIIISAILKALSGNSPDLNGMYFLLLYVAGFGLTSRISRELHDKRNASTWLLLPASTLEKFLTMLLLPTLLLAGGLVIYMTIVSLVIEFGIGAFFTTGNNFFNPFSIGILKGTAVYIAIQAPFLLGAIYFKKHAMSYTFLSLFFICRHILDIYTFYGDVFSWRLYKADISRFQPYRRCVWVGPGRHIVCHDLNR